MVRLNLYLVVTTLYIYILDFYLDRVTEYASRVDDDEDGLVRR